MEKTMSVIKIENEEDLKVLSAIEETVMKNVNLGFDLQVLDILDDEEATSQKIEALKGMLSEDIVLRLVGLGNSTHYGRLGAGKILNFREIILRLGMQPAKVYILALSLYFIKPAQEMCILAARSFVTSMLGKILAKQMACSEDSVKKVELGGMLLEVGKIFMFLYGEKLDKKMDEEFIHKYYRYLGLRAVEIFKLPEFLGEILSTAYFTFRTSSLAWPSIVDLAHTVVDKNFRQHGKIIIQASLPDEEGVVLSTYGATLAGQLEAIGLGSYLEIIPILSHKQEIQRLRKIAQASKAA